MIEVKQYKQIETIEKEGVRPNERNFKESNTFSIKHNTVKDKVKSLVRFDKYARKDRFYLCLLYWIKNGDITMNVDFKDFKKITKPETITRCFRELKEQANNGNKELRWLLYDEENNEHCELMENLNHDYYQDKKNSEIAKVVK